jgi:hypothetical protein
MSDGGQRQMSDGGQRQMNKYFMITSTHCERVLDIYAGNTTPGTKVIIWDRHGGDNQVWFQEPLTQTIRSKMDPSLCLTINGW